MQQGQALAHHAKAAAVVQGDGGVEAPPAVAHVSSAALLVDGEGAVLQMPCVVGSWARSLWVT